MLRTKKLTLPHGVTITTFPDLYVEADNPHKLVVRYENLPNLIGEDYARVMYVEVVGPGRVHTIAPPFYLN